MKYCKRCNRELPEQMFAKDASQKDGLTRYCKDCRSSYARQWYKDVRYDITKRYRRHNMFLPLAVVGYMMLKAKYGEVTFETIQKMKVRATRLSTEKAIAFIKEELEGGDE